MIMSRALGPSEPVATTPIVAAKPRVPDAAPANSALDFFRQPLAPIFTGIAVMVLVVAAIHFARSAGLVAALWGAGGVALAVWLRNARGRAYDLCFGGVLALGIAAGELLAGNTYAQTALFTVANMVEIVTALVLVRRFAPTLNLNSVDGACRFLLAAAVVGPIPAALLGAVGLQALTGNVDLLDSFQTWWFGHALGIAVIASFGVSLSKRHLLLLRSPWRVAEGLGLIALLSVVCAFVFFHTRIQFAFVVIPLLILMAARFRVAGVSTGLIIVAVTAVGGTMVGRGPFTSAGPDLADQALLAQLMVLLGCMPILLVASLLEERDRLSDRAKAGQLRAERASQAKSRLLANVAHEIKSPVGGIIGIGDLWRAGQLGEVSPTQAEMADMLVRTARQVEALAHDLLDVARAESGAVKVDLRPTDVPGVLEDVRRATALRPDAQGLRLQVVSEGDGLLALADSQRLTQVVSNLASNAVKYGASGGVVAFRASRIHDGVRIEVIDRGVGLTPEKQAQLFEPFNRLGLERSTVEGHGIGLALAKRLVELQGGTIGVSSVPGEGATFWIELPAA